MEYAKRGRDRTIWPGGGREGEDLCIDWRWRRGERGKKRWGRRREGASCRDRPNLGLGRLDLQEAKHRNLG